MARQRQKTRLRNALSTVKERARALNVQAEREEPDKARSGGGVRGREGGGTGDGCKPGVETRID